MDDDVLLEEMKRLLYDGEALDRFRGENALLVREKILEKEKFLEGLKDRDFSELEDAFNRLHSNYPYIKFNAGNVLLEVKKVFDDNTLFFYSVEVKKRFYRVESGDWWRSSYDEKGYTFLSVVKCDPEFHVPKKGVLRNALLKVIKDKLRRRRRVISNMAEGVYEFELKKKEVGLALLDYLLKVKKLKSKEFEGVLEYWEGLLLYLIRECDLKDLRDSYLLLDVFNRNKLLKKGKYLLKDLVTVKKELSEVKK